MIVWSLQARTLRHLGLQGTKEQNIDWLAETPMQS